MYRPRIIPLLLLHKNGVVKTIRFANPAYIGDPINIVKIFNQKYADELLIADIDTHLPGHSINYDLLKLMAGEAFMPLTYSGGVRSLQDIERIIQCGIERVCINSAALNRDFLQEACKIFGSSTIASFVDVKKNWLGKIIIKQKSASVRKPISFNSYLKYLEDCGVGEIIIQDIDRDGTRKGYNHNLLKEALSLVQTPVIIAGGARNYDDIKTALLAGAAGAAAGSLFVYSGSMNAVLINFPDEKFRQTLVRR
jgi:cyclase